MICLQQSALEQAAELSRAGHYLEAWQLAASEPRARAYVRYHAGDLDGALTESRSGLRAEPRDPWLLATGTEIALSLHRGAAAQALLDGWRANPAPEDAPRIQSAAGELMDLRATEAAAAAGIRRARWISTLATALALGFLLHCARRRA